MNLNNLFQNFCKKNNLEINTYQLTIIDELKNYYNLNFNKSFLNKFFTKKNSKPAFYLQGGVGVGKTMILNFFFDLIEEKKLRKHFNEFMLNFHDFAHERKEKNEENIINLFVKDLKLKTKLIYFDEFQVTNIVDAMILGKLFKKIFDEKIKVVFSSNIDIDELYKDGLQRDQFIPFLKILKKNCLQKKLLIKDDYRSNNNMNLERFISPINESNFFKFNKFFRKITKNKKKSLKIFDVKGRKLSIENFYEGVMKFEFADLCDKNLGSEDYIMISNNCNFIFIENLPNFDDNNSNQQQRFITLIDIIYEKKIPLMITSKVNLDLIKSSKSLIDPFKRTISRLYELTSIDYN